MDIELVEPSAPGIRPIGDPAGGPEPGSPEETIDEVDHLLDEVEAALTRLDDGSYGTCRTCGGPIDDHRLAGLPTAQTCATCDGTGTDAETADDQQDDVPARPSGSVGRVDATAVDGAAVDATAIDDAAVDAARAAVAADWMTGPDPQVDPDGP
jgi:hypothetical protein